MRRTPTRLADGRELIYFDSDATTADRTTVVDRRDLDPTATASEIRHDAVLDEWVTIASHRQGRTHLPPADECPLCPSTADRHTEIPADDYDVVVFENRFPSLAEDADPDFTATEERRPGLGRCEVVCFTSDHDTALSQLPPDRVRLVLDAWIDRSDALSRLPFVEQVFCFENRGQEIGVTLNHPHGQIYGYPFVTPRTRSMLDAARRYRDRTGRDVFADRLAQELAEDCRVVTSSEHWVAFVPFAARWPVEVHLYPRRPVPDLPALDEAARDDFAHVYLEVLQRDGRAVRRTAPLHLGLAPGAGAGRPGPRLAAPRGLLGEAGREQAEVPGRVGVRHGGLHQRRRPRADRGHPARRAAAMTEATPGDVADCFRQLTGSAPEGVWSSPGRVNLIGEHTDYNDGFALPFAIEARAWVAVSLRADGVLRMRSVQQPDGDTEVALDEIAPGRPDGWAAYVAGVVWAAREAGHPVSGADVLVDGRIPLGSGLSSSHALECAVATALDELHGTGSAPDDLARLALVSENDFVGAPTGMMDQIASLRAVAEHALFLDNRSLAVEQVPLRPAQAGLRLLVLDTRVHHGHADGAYGDRRAACERAARLLEVDALRDVTLDDLDARARPAPGGPARPGAPRGHRGCPGARRGGRPARRRLRRPRVADGRVARVAAGRLRGQLRRARRGGRRWPARPARVGARMTGGGFGGSAIALVPEASVTGVTEAVTAAFAERGWDAPVALVVTPCQGARRDA